MALDHSEMRASDADRDRLREVLSTAFNEGRLSYIEFSERVEQLFEAKTYADLNNLIADLPQGDHLPAKPVQINTAKTQLSLQALGWIFFGCFLLLGMSVTSAIGNPWPQIALLITAFITISFVDVTRRRRHHSR